MSGLEGWKLGGEASGGHFIERADGSGFFVNCEKSELPVLLAAPDMLATLRYIAKTWPDSFAARDARAAIAKAEGRS